MPKIGSRNMMQILGHHVYICYACNLGWNYTMKVCDIVDSIIWYIHTYSLCKLITAKHIHDIYSTYFRVHKVPFPFS